MENIKDNILQYLTCDTTTGALQIKGNWGCGKTYFVKEELFKELLEREKPIIPVMISLFGLDSVKDIHYSLLNSYINIMNDKKGNVTDDMNRGLDYLDFKYGSDKAIFNFNLHDEEELIYKIIPRENVVFILDDVERFMNESNVEELMGAINNLIENRRYKVIIIYNDDFKKDDKSTYIKSNFKEKIIGCTVKYSPSYDEMLGIMVKMFNCTEFENFMRKDEVLNIFNPENYPKEYKAFFNNLRIIKFILTIFYNVYLHYKGDEKAESRLLYYLTFIVGTSIEYKTDKIDDADCHNLDVFTDKLDLDDFGYNDERENLFTDETDAESKREKEKKENDNLYAKRFYDRYAKKFKQNIVFHPQLYYHITAGKNIDFEDLDKNLSKAVSEFSSDASQGNIIIDKMLKGFRFYDDNTFSYDLIKLLNYTEKGDLKGCIYYVNAAYILRRFKEIVGLSEDDLKEKIQCGIDLYFSKNKIEKDERLHLEHTFNPDNWPVDYLIKKIDEQNDIYSNENIEELKDLFVNDMKEFVNRFKDSRYFRSEFYNIPILEHICSDEVFKKITELTPLEVYLLSEFLENRYKPEFKDDLKIEIKFLDFVKNAIKEVPKDNKKLSTNLINNTLRPEIDKAIKIFQQ